MADIFLSYAREDEPRARSLAAALESRGWSVWWDRRIPHGKDFNEYIDKELHGARCIIVLWSAMALASRFVRDEAAEGLNDGRLVPCLLEAVRPPLGFRQLQTANLAEWLHGASSDEFERLVQSIAAIVPPLSKPTDIDRSGSDEATPSSPPSNSGVLEPFGFDVYISYAYRDNLQLLHGNRGWIANFATALTNRLGQLVGVTPRLVMNPKVDGSDVCPDAVRRKLPQVAALVAVVSPHYANSEGSLEELRAFFEAAEKRGGVHVGDKLRIFKVIKTPVPIERLPQQLRPILGYEFFKIDPDTGRAREFNMIFGGEAQRDFWTMLDDLAHDIAALLGQLPIRSGSTTD